MSDLFRRLLFASIVFFALFSAHSNPALASDVYTPRIAALGGAGHAGPLLNDAIYLNPSFISLLPSYSISANYGWWKEDATRGRNLNASVQDGRAELFQAGFGYTIREDVKFLHLGLSKSPIPKLSFGASAKYVIPKETGSSKFMDGMVSFTGTPYDWMFASLVIDNLIESPESRKTGFRREFILGTKFNIEKLLMIYVDPHLFPSAPAGSSKYGIEYGLEIPVFTDFFLRAGGFRNSTVPYVSARGRGFAGGIGWLAPRISIDYADVHVIEPVAVVAHTVGLTIYF